MILKVMRMMKMVLLIRFWNSKCSYEAESSVFDANIYYFNMHGSMLLVSIKEVSLPWWHYSQHQQNNDFISFLFILEISNMATECGLGRSVNPKVSPNLGCRSNTGTNMPSISDFVSSRYPAVMTYRLWFWNISIVYIVHRYYTSKVWSRLFTYLTRYWP